MKTDYITPESAADQNPTEKNQERLQEKKQPLPNPGKNEGNNYDKGSAEEQSGNDDFDPRNYAEAEGGEGEQEQEQEPKQGDQDFQKETGPATPPEKTREAPQGNPQA